MKIYWCSVGTLAISFQLVADNAITYLLNDITFIEVDYKHGILDSGNNYLCGTFGCKAHAPQISHSLVPIVESAEIRSRKTVKCT